MTESEIVDIISRESRRIEHLKDEIVGIKAEIATTKKALLFWQGVLAEKMGRKPPNLKKKNGKKSKKTH